MKFVAVITAFMSVIGFSSCISGGETEYDFMDYLTVTQDYMGRTCLVGDYTGLTLYPANSSILSALQLSDGSYYKRAYAGAKLAEEYTETKKNYTISNLYVASAIPYMDFNMYKDTLVGDYGLSGLNKIWAKTGYVNVDFNVNVEANNTSTFYNDLHMYVTRASNDTLYTKLRYVKSTDMGQTYTILVSFGLPKQSWEYNSLTPKNDSIVINVEAENVSGQVNQMTTRYRYEELFN